MIPEFTRTGLLPPGIHSATWAEFAERFQVFQRSSRRIVLGDRLQTIYDEARKSGIVRRFLVVGSFVTQKAEPNDYDCLLVLDPATVGTTLPPFQYNLISRRMARRMYNGDVTSALAGSAALIE